MPVLLNIDDTGELSPVTSSALSKAFVPRSEYEPGTGGGGGGGEALPSHVTGRHPHVWAPPVYNGGAPSMALIRGLIVNALYAGGDHEIHVMGDSKTEGHNTGPGGVYWRWSWVGILRDILGAVEGFIVAMHSGSDSRWSGTLVQGGTLRQPGLVNGPEATQQHTFTFSTPHTGGSFRIHCAAGGTVTISVDGGAGQNLTIPAGDGYKTVTPTVSGEGAHTYKITTTAAINLYGFRPTYSGPRLKITNLARGGMNAISWMPGDRPNGLCHWDAMVSLPTPDAIFCALGTNQPGDDGSVGGPQIAALWDQIATLGLPSLIITPGGLDLTGAEDWYSQYEAQFKAADRLHFPLIDFASVIGTGADAQARGLMADTAHENRKGYAYEAAALAALLGIPTR